MIDSIDLLDDALTEMKDDIERLLTMHLEITHYLTTLMKERAEAKAAAGEDGTVTSIAKERSGRQSSG